MSCTCVTSPARRPASPGSTSVTYSGRTPSLSAPSRQRRARPPARVPATSSSPPSPRAGRKFMPGEPMKWPTKVCCGRSNSCVGAADLHRPAARHHHHLLGEGERLDLVVRDVDQRQLELVVDLLELAPQLPLEVRVDHRQRLVEQHRRHVLAHQAAAERDLLLGVGGEAGGALVELAAHLQHLGDLADALARSARRGTPRLRSGKARFSATVMVS